MGGDQQHDKGKHGKSVVLKKKKQEDVLRLELKESSPERVSF